MSIQVFYIYSGLLKSETTSENTSTVHLYNLGFHYKTIVQNQKYFFCILHHNVTFITLFWIPDFQWGLRCLVSIVCVHCFFFIIPGVAVLRLSPVLDLLSSSSSLSLKSSRFPMSVGFTLIRLARLCMSSSLQRKPITGQEMWGRLFVKRCRYKTSLNLLWKPYSVNCMCVFTSRSYVKLFDLMEIRHEILLHYYIPMQHLYKAMICEFAVLFWKFLLCFLTCTCQGRNPPQCPTANLLSGQAAIPLVGFKSTPNIHNQNQDYVCFCKKKRLAVVRFPHDWI